MRRRSEAMIPMMIDPRESVFSGAVRGSPEELLRVE